MTKNPEKVRHYNTLLENSLKNFNSNSRLEVMWTDIQTATHTSAIDAFGKKQGTPQNDWYLSRAEELDPLITAKRAALQKYKESPTAQSHKALKKSRANVQKAVRSCVNKYWTELCNEIQTAANKGNIKAMFDGIKKATGPHVKKAAPLRSTTGEIISNKAQQMERWVEHYSELYSRDNRISQSALDEVEHLPEMSELDIQPTTEELAKAIDKLSLGKAPGKDGIPAEIIKCGKTSLLEPLHKLLCKCWEEGEVPQSMRDANIVTLYKNKGDRSDCNNYRGISLLSVVGKLFARIALNRLQKLADQVYPESQCGFRSKRSTIDMIFSLRQLQEKCREQHQPLYIAFIDLTKAFDLVSQDGLFKILPLISCPPRLLSIIK
jgi:hypothetical protein